MGFQYKLEGETLTKEVISYTAHLHRGVLGGTQDDDNWGNIHDDVKVCFMKMKVLAFLKLLCSEKLYIFTQHGANVHTRLLTCRSGDICAVCAVSPRHTSCYLDCITRFKHD